MAGQLKVNGVTLATEESGTVTLEAPQIKDSSNNVILDQSGTNPVLKNVEVVNNSSMMFRNKIINGDMRIDQRNAGASVTPTGDAYTLDRWSTWVYQSSKFSVQQNAGSVTPPVGFSNYLGITSTSAYSVPANEGFAITQKIEGYNVADLGWGAAGALTVTLSFWVRSSLTGTFGGVINNSAQSRSYPFTYEITLSNTWEYKTITIDGDTSGTWLTTNGTGFFVKFGLGVGSALSGTAGSWATANYASSTGATSVVGTSGATFYITGVQLEEGTVATPFEHRPYGAELALCQRYFQSVQMSGIFLHPYHTAYALVNCPLFVPLRKASSVTISKTARIIRLTTPGVLDYWIDGTGGSLFSGGGDWGANMYINNNPNRDDTLSHLALRFYKSGSSDFPDQEPIQITGIVNSTNDNLDPNGGYFDIECEL